MRAIPCIPPALWACQALFSACEWLTVFRGHPAVVNKSNIAVLSVIAVAPRLPSLRDLPAKQLSDAGHDIAGIRRYGWRLRLHFLTDNGRRFRLC